MRQWPLLVVRPKEVRHLHEFGPRHRRRGEAEGDLSWPGAGRPHEPIEMPRRQLPAPVMAFRVERRAWATRECLRVASPPAMSGPHDRPAIASPADGRSDRRACPQVHVRSDLDRLRDRLAGVTLQPRGSIPGDASGPRPRRTEGTRTSGGRGSFAPATSNRAAAPGGLRVRRQDQGSRCSPLVHSGGGEGLALGYDRPACLAVTRSIACACGCSTAPTTRSTPPRIAFSWRVCTSR